MAPASNITPHRREENMKKRSWLGSILIASAIFIPGAFNIGITPALADCSTINGVFHNCGNNLKEGTQNVFRSEDEAERARAVDKADRGCVQCASDYLQNEIQTFGNDSSSASGNGR